jgi:hypothetical protein
MLCSLKQLLIPQEQTYEFTYEHRIQYPMPPPALRAVQFVDGAQTNFARSLGMSAPAVPERASNKPQPVAFGPGLNRISDKSCACFQHPKLKPAAIAFGAGFSDHL